MDQSKQVIIVRHGSAVDIGENGVKTDSERMLSADGIKKTELVAAGLKAFGVKVGRFASSPLARARETAAIMAEALAPQAKIEIIESMRPVGAHEKTIEWLDSEKAESLLICGHAPDVSELASLLISGHESLDIPFKKASALCVSFAGKVEAGLGRLEWFLKPGQAGLMADSKKRD
jgi:phosphohistidine phosphatase